MKKTTFSGLIAAGTAIALLPLAAAADYPGGKRGHEGGHHKAMLETLDTNGDGDISKAEIEASRAEKFAAVDANGDGAVTAAEMQAHQDAMEAKREAEREARKAERFQKRFAALDTDGNGTISAAEFSARPMKGFDRMDADGDGTITAEEREAAKAKFKGKRGERMKEKADAPATE